MPKIIFNSVEIKNFLSYGNTPTTIDFKKGINIVLGTDKDKDRSNGAGKTSFLEAIPFALFGQITKGVPLAKIVNWKNKKRCEVNLNFMVGDKEYTISRGIKPGKLELYENGSLVPILSDKRVFQKEIEEDILGMDYKAFINLIFQNANNNVSMFSTPAAEKRKVIENLFNLSVYSKVNELTNRKISGIQQKISEIELEISFKEKRLNEVLSELENFFIPDITEYENKVESLRNKLINYRDMGDINESIDSIDNVLKSLEESLDTKNTSKENIIVESSEVSNSLSSLKSEKSIIEKRIRSIGDIKEKKETLEKLKNALETLKGLDSREKDLKNEIRVLEENLKSQEVKKGNLNSDIKHLKNKIKELPDPNNLKDKTECPLCMQECDYNSVKSHVDEITDDLNVEIKTLTENLNSVLENIKTLESDFYDKSKELEKIQENIKKRTVVERKIAEMSDIEEKQRELDESMSRLTEIDNDISLKNGELLKYNDLKSDINNDINDIKHDINENRKTLTDLHNELSKRKELEKEIEYEEKTLESKKEQAENARTEHQIKTLSVETFRSEITTFEEEKKKKEKLFDYLNYIKSTLKDECVKQYAISNITPFLQSKTNEYLSETGHSYYVELDNWLNGTILGPGVGDCDFGNMSGGEGKSIDMALKFAMMDVARLQAGSYPDILVLDELLDSSIDTYGLEKLVDIVKHKQKEDELKVFIVSHREEMDQFGYDTLYNVTKENGFSTIMEM